MTTCPDCGDPTTNAGPCPDCLAMFDPAPAAEQSMDWLEPTDGAAVVKEAKKGVVRQVVRAAAHPAATITLMITAPPETVPEGVKHRMHGDLVLVPCGCTSDCGKESVIGYTICHPCKSTFKVEDYEFHLKSEWHNRDRQGART